MASLTLDLENTHSSQEYVGNLQNLTTFHEFKSSFFLNNVWVKKEIAMEILKYLELNDNLNSTYRYLWEAERAKLS